MTVPTVSGFVETALYVADLDRSHAFYQRVFGFPEIMREDGRLHALAVAEKQVLLLFLTGGSTRPMETPGGRIPAHDGRGTLHLAFAIQPDDVAPWRDRLRELDVPVSSEVNCSGGGHSIYFRDPDGHLIELVTPGCWSVY